MRDFQNNNKPTPKPGTKPVHVPLRRDVPSPTPKSVPRVPSPPPTKK